MSLSAIYFEQLFSANPDPWAFRSRWYEKRKRALTLALLPRQRYGRVFEPACANGELSLGLAERGDRLLCMDLSHTAVALAAERLAGYPEVQVVQGRLPEEWPEGQFDLIVLSELGYYLDSNDWRQVIDQARASLSPQGAVLACHWLQPIAGCPQTGAQVHAMLDAHLHLPRTVRHEEPDFILELWCRGPYRPDLEEPIQ
ncbi:bifunctional 2-polyprenyl-6-hydroxyphenol methylase/3-demethylubiquinol 3-O-methyltransferase UbiG [Pseudomonas sp. Irchel 3H3]|uniref:class I SAM-dependent methyltransferase n=1 Tax=Pseudomonas sp. Irchel 3H3 TaxID=2009038 RepID=UPI000BA2E067|nr:class I SAM-dependent methyltransferase [Pseudomonas sp. Irchel 3H3]